MLCFVNYAAGTSSIFSTLYTLALISLLPGTMSFAFIGVYEDAITDMNKNGTYPAQISCIATEILFDVLAILLRTYYTLKKEF